MKQMFIKSVQAQQMRQFHCPRWSELPGIALYMDQVTGYVNEIFAPLSVQQQEKTLTKAMVNNYVKLKVMTAPEKKKYHRAHMAYLVTICMLKQVFSLPEITQMIGIQIAHCPVEQAYDRFCDELELAFEQLLEDGFCPSNQPESAELALLRRAVQACAGKVFVQKELEFFMVEISSEHRLKGEKNEAR